MAGSEEDDVRSIRLIEEVPEFPYRRGGKANVVFVGKPSQPRFRRSAAPSPLPAPESDEEADRASTFEGA